MNERVQALKTQSRRISWKCEGIDWQELVMPGPSSCPQLPLSIHASKLIEGPGTTRSGSGGTYLISSRHGETLSGVSDENNERSPSKEGSQEWIVFPLKTGN